MEYKITLDDWVVDKLKDYAEYQGISIEKVVIHEAEELALSLGEMPED